MLPARMTHTGKCLSYYMVLAPGTRYHTRGIYIKRRRMFTGICRYEYLVNSKRNLCTYAQISTDLNISNGIMRSFNNFSIETRSSRELWQP